MPLVILVQVGGFEKSGFGPAADEEADVAAALVGSGVENVGIAWIHEDLGDTGVFTDSEDSFPSQAAIGGFVEAAIAAGRPEGALGGDVNDFGIARVNKNPLDVFGMFEAGARPGFAAVGAFVNAIAKADAAQGLVLARAEPEHVRIFRVDGDRPERVGAALIENGIEGNAMVACFPEAARGGGDVPDVLVFGIDGDVLDAAGKAGRADSAQGQTGECGGVERLIGGWGAGDHSGSDESEREEDGKFEN
jgi:hypothetical protein